MPQKISDEFLYEIRVRNSIEDVISSYISLKRRGVNLVGLCPFHNEKTPSFTVYPETNSFYCFGCGAGGEVITFVKQIENLSFTESVKFLADRSGMKMPEMQNDDYDRLRQRVLLANRKAAKFFHENLMKPENKEALNYFKKRGLTLNTIKHFGLGYARNSWDSLYKYLKSEGFTDYEMYSANLIMKNKNGRYYDMFRNRPIFPIIDVRGNVIAFGGRALGDDIPKYLNSSESVVFKKSRELFALNFAKKNCKDSIILAEGYMDVIALHQAGFENAVATLGTSLTSEQARIISRYTKEVIISYDSDEAGKKALDRAIGIFETIGTPVRVLEIVGGKDPDEFLKQEGGKEKFGMMLSKAENDTEYRILKARRKYSLETSAEKVAFLSEVAEIISTLSSAVERDVYATKIATELETDKSAILEDAEKIAKRKYRAKKAEENKEFVKVSKRDSLNPERQKNLRGASAEEGLIALLLKNPDFYGTISQKIKPDEFLTSLNKKLYSFIADRLNEGRSVDLSVFSKDFSPEEIGRLVEIENREKSRANTLEEAVRCVEVICAENRKSGSVADMSNDEWKKYMDTISNSKK